MNVHENDLPYLTQQRYAYNTQSHKINNVIVLKVQCKRSFHQMKGDGGMHNAKNHRNKSLHSKMIVQSCVTPEPE